MRVTRTLAVYAFLMVTVSICSGCVSEQGGRSGTYQGSEIGVSQEDGSTQDGSLWGAIQKMDTWVRRTLW